MSEGEFVALLKVSGWGLSIIKVMSSGRYWGEVYDENKYGHAILETWTTYQTQEQVVQELIREYERYIEAQTEEDK